MAGIGTVAGGVSKIKAKLGKISSSMKAGRIGAKKKLLGGAKSLVKDEIDFAAKAGNVRKNAQAAGVNMNTYNKVSAPVLTVRRLAPGAKVRRPRRIGVKK